MFFKSIFAAVCLGLFWSPAIAEEILTNGAPPIDPTRYTQFATQSRFDGVVALVAYPIVKEKKGPPHAGCTGTMISPTLVLTAGHCISTSGSKTQVTVAKNGAPGTINGAPTAFSFILGPNKSGPQALKIVDYRLPPTYKPPTQQGLDLALIKVADAKTGSPVSTYLRDGVPETISFIKLYSGHAEFTQPSPNLGTSIGYGFLGDGLNGEHRGSDGTKRAGLLLVEKPAILDLISSTFLDRGQLFKAGLPNNFLEIFPAHGDSGGPLFQAIGTGSATVQTGVAHSILASGGSDYPYLTYLGTDPADGKNNKFHSYAYWTEVSPNISWLKSAAASMGDVLPTPDPGP